MNEKQNRDLNKELFDAVCHNDLNLVSLAIKSGANLNQPTSYGGTLTHIAAAMGFREVLSLLLDAGLPPNAIDDRGDTPLLNAVKSRSFEVVKTLVAAGADVNSNNVLHIAFKNNRKDIALFLAEQGADLNTIDSDGMTPLGICIKKDDIGSLTKLLDLNVDVNLASLDFEDNTPASSLRQVLYLFKDDKKKYERYLNLLLKAGADPNGIKGENRTPLQDALMYSTTSAVKKLVEYKADVNLTPPGTIPPLIITASLCKTNTALLLIKAGADINAENDFGETSLGVAIITNNIDLLEELLRAGVSANKHIMGQTPLFKSLELDNADIARILVLYGADVNTRNKSGSLILTELIAMRRFRAANSLIDLGANPLAACDTQKGLEELEQAIGICLKYRPELHEILSDQLEKHKRLCSEDGIVEDSVNFEYDI